MKAKQKPTFQTKEPCYGCGVEMYVLPVETVFRKHKFCSRTCLHVNYFKFPSLQNTHHHETQSQSILA